MTKFLNVMNVKNIFYQNIGKECVVKLRTGGVFILNNIYEAENDEHGGAFSAFIIESNGLDAKKRLFFVQEVQWNFQNVTLFGLKTKNLVN